MGNEIIETRKPEKPEKPKAAKKRKQKPREIKIPEFPIGVKINDYGFLHFGVGVLKALGWSKGLALKMERNADGSVTLRKA